MRTSGHVHPPFYRYQRAEQRRTLSDDDHDLGGAAFAGAFPYATGAVCHHVSADGSCRSLQGKSLQENTSRR